VLKSSDAAEHFQDNAKNVCYNARTMKVGVFLLKITVLGPIEMVTERNV
jgi:hypothetical protein